MHDNDMTTADGNNTMIMQVTLKLETIEIQDWNTM